MTPGFEVRRAWETVHSTAWSPPVRMGQIARFIQCNFSIRDLPGTLFFTYTFSIHIPLLPPIHSHIHSGSLIPHSAAPPSFLIPSLFLHWATQRWLAGETGRHLAQHPPCPSLRTTRFWACALRAGRDAWLSSLFCLPQKMTLRTNPRSSPTHHCSSEQFPGRIHWVSRKMFPVAFS